MSSCVSPLARTTTRWRAFATRSPPAWAICCKARMPEISVVIPTYNRLDTLADVIPTLLAQDLAPSEYELLVCDSNSNDGTERYLAGVAAKHPNVRHLAASF